MKGVPWDLGLPSSDDILVPWETNVAGKAVSIVHFWHFWSQDANNDAPLPFSAGPLDKVRAHGAIPMVTWPTETMGKGQSQPHYSYDNIINDPALNQYIRDWATAAAAWGREPGQSVGKPFFLRFDHEMNGDWFVWSQERAYNVPGSAGNPRGYRFADVWRHVYNIFQEVGATNASFVWCPNVEYLDYPGQTQPKFFGDDYYPGDQFVDWSCLDGYNWGSPWDSFDAVFQDSYNWLSQRAPGKPMMIGEWGSAEDGSAPARKADWITDALGTQLPYHYPLLKAQVWYNWYFDKRDWRVESSTNATDAWRTAIAQPWYLANVFGSLDAVKVPVPSYP